MMTIARVAHLAPEPQSFEAVLALLTRDTPLPATPAIVLVEPGAEPLGPALARALPSVRLLAASRHDGPGATLNAALETLSAPLVALLDWRDELPAGFFPTAAARFEADPALPLLLPTLVKRNALGRTAPCGPLRADIPLLVAHSASLSSSVVLRRQAWLDAGRFDTALPALEVFELCLRLALKGASPSVASELLVIRTSSDPGPQSNTQRALGRILKRHAPALEAYAAEILFEQDRRLRALRDRAATRELAVARGPRALVLRYRRIARLQSDPWKLAVPPELFDAQMAVLARCFETVDLLDLVAGLPGALTDGAVAVTFDDGYFDQLGEAQPILARWGVPATFFPAIPGPPSAAANEAAVLSEPFVWDKLEQLLLSSEAVPETVTLTLSGRARRLPTATADQRASALRAIASSLRAASPVEIDAALRALVRWSGRPLASRGRDRRLGPGDLRTLAARPGVTIGAHGCNHLALPWVHAELAFREAFSSRAALEALLGRPVLAFSYPYGAHDRTGLAAVEAADYQCAVTCESRAVRVGDDRLRVPRVTVPAVDGEAFEKLLREHLHPGARAGSASTSS